MDPLIVRWASAVVIIGAGMVAGIVADGGWWVLGSLALAAAIDRFVWRRTLERPDAERT